MQHLAYLSEMLLWFIQLSSNIISEYFASCFCKLEIGQYSYYWAKLLADLTIITKSQPPKSTRLVVRTHMYSYRYLTYDNKTLPQI